MDVIKAILSCFLILALVRNSLSETGVNARYKRDGSSTGNTNIQTIETGCEALDSCLNSLTSLITIGENSLTSDRCVSIADEMMCIHNVIQNSPICVDLPYYNHIDYKLDMMSIQLRLFCGKYNEFSRCDAMDKCMNKVNYPLRSPLLAEPQFWCATLKYSLICIDTYKSTCSVGDALFKTIMITIEKLCPSAVDVSVVVYEGSSATVWYISNQILLMVIAITFNQIL